MIVELRNALRLLGVAIGDCPAGWEDSLSKLDYVLARDPSRLDWKSWLKVARRQPRRLFEVDHGESSAKMVLDFEIEEGVRIAVLNLNFLDSFQPSQVALAINGPGFYNEADRLTIEQNVTSWKASELPRIPFDKISRGKFLQKVLAFRKAEQPFILDSPPELDGALIVIPIPAHSAGESK